MIEERARVSRVDAGGVWVRALGAEGCARCAEGRGCGGGMLSRLVSPRRPEVAVSGSLPALRAGDAVVVGLPENALLSAALVVYAAPVAGMFAFGAFAHQVLVAHDVLVAGFGLLGLGVGFLYTHWHSQRPESQARFRPVLLRRAVIEPSDCARLPSI